MNLYDLIETFNFGYGVIDSIPPKVDESAKTFISCLNMIKSEVQELQKALSDNDRLEIMDALGDIIYLVIGLGVRTGFRIEPRVTPKSLPKKSLDGELVESIKENSEAWMEVIDTFLESVSSRGRLGQQVSAIVWKDSFQSILDEACLSLSDCGTNYYSVVERIHQSNMNKFASSEEHALQSVEVYKSWVSPTGERYNSPSYRPGPDGRWVIYDQEKNKVLKAKGWTPPDLSDF